MIKVETDRIYSIYVRINSRIPWKFATYGGRWETPEKALKVAEANMDSPFEYRIENFDGSFVQTGFVGK